ncbi:MAG: zf-HC2 domain-containing protein, partial [Bryobacteraceae bacterium]
MVTCKDFLRELADFLDESVDPALRQELESHISQCPNCWVICDTTKKTIQVYK